MSLLHTLLAFLVALGVLVIVHELGHYLVARWCGVKVLRFSVGFGRPLLTRRYGPDATEWVIAALPLGGYVSMLDERELPEGEVLSPEDAKRAFNRQAPLKRMAIVIAGPVANLLLAVALYAGLFMAGTEEPRARIAAPTAQSPAALAGLQDGDEIRAIDGKPVRSWMDARWRLLEAAADRSAPSTASRCAAGWMRAGGCSKRRPIDANSNSRSTWPAAVRRPGPSTCRASTERRSRRIFPKTSACNCMRPSRS